MDGRIIFVPRNKRHERKRDREVVVDWGFANDLSFFSLLAFCFRNGQYVGNTESATSETTKERERERKKI